MRLDEELNTGSGPCSKSCGGVTAQKRGVQVLDQLSKEKRDEVFKAVHRDLNEGCTVVDLRGF